MTTTTLHYSFITIVIMMGLVISGLGLVLVLLVLKVFKVSRDFRAIKEFKVYKVFREFKATRDFKDFKVIKVCRDFNCLIEEKSLIRLWLKYKERRFCKLDNTLML